MKLFIEEIIGQPVSEGTLYTLLPRLASPSKYGYLTSYIEETSKQRKRRYYVLTERGEKELERWTEEWKRTKTTIDNVIGKIILSGVT
jgi:PadR family transcriptional regulator PadR